MHPYDYIFIGLSLDVVGAVVLAKSFMLKDPQDAYYEGLPVLGGNRSLVKGALIQRGEAWSGPPCFWLDFYCRCGGISTVVSPRTGQG